MKEEKNHSKTKPYNKSLNKIVTGTGFVSIGFLISYIFIFVSSILIARRWTENEIGVYSLAYSLFEIFMIICTLGLIQGLVRSIAHARGKKELQKIPIFILSSIFYSIITSIVISFILFFLSDYISNNIFHESALIFPLKILAISLPFVALNIIFIAIFRGYEKIRPFVYFRHILGRGLILFFVIIIIFLNYSFNSLFYGHLLSGIFILISIIIYTIKKGKLKFLKKYDFKLIFSSETKELLSFSLPLLIVDILDLVILWSSTLVLGILKTTAETGFYNVAKPFSSFLGFPMVALMITFIPVFSKLYSRGKLDEMRSNYLILTKWICLLTLPVFIIFFLYTDQLISIIVGPNYLPSANALKILAFAYIFMNFTGPNISTLIAFGKSRFLMNVTIVSAILIISLNFLLIPTYGIIGAAIGTSSAFIFMALIKIFRVYSLGKIKPFGYKLIKPTIFSFIFIIPIYLITNSIINNWWSLILLVILLYVVYFISVILTKSFEEEDLLMLELIEQKTGVKTDKIKTFLTRFI
jgi:O-antigen/teichoic acid export membrane protein